MSKRILVTGLTVLFGSVCLDPGVRATTPCGSDEGFAEVLSRPAPEPQLFKIRAGGQLDTEHLVVAFAGQANQIGQFTATGTIDPFEDNFREMRGELSLTRGDTLLFGLEFAYLQPAGTLVWFWANNGTGQFQRFHGTASGLVTVDADGLFSLSIDGTSYFDEPNTVSCQDLRPECTSTCEESPGPLGYCVEQSGASTITTLECCCCTKGFTTRCFNRL